MFSGSPNGKEESSWKRPLPTLLMDFPWYTGSPTSTFGVYNLHLPISPCLPWSLKNKKQLLPQRRDWGPSSCHESKLLRGALYALGQLGWLFLSFRSQPSATSSASLSQSSIWRRPNHDGDSMLYFLRSIYFYVHLFCSLESWLFGCLSSPPATARMNGALSVSFAVTSPGAWHRVWQVGSLHSYWLTAWAQFYPRLGHSQAVKLWARHFISTMGISSVS